MQSHGCTCKGWWTEGEPEPTDGFLKRFPDVPRVDDRNILLSDPEIDMILIADVPVRRAARAIEAMRAGKAPGVRLNATHLMALEIAGLEDLRAHAADQT